MPVTIEGLELLGHKSGRLIPGDFAGNPQKATVIFDTAYSDTDYSIALDQVTINDHVFVLSTESKTNASFIVSLNTGNKANLVEVLWLTKPIGEI